MTKPASKAKGAAKRTKRSAGSQQRRVKPLLRTITELYWLVIEHHNAAVMREEHCACTICTQKKWANVLNRAAKQMKAP